MHAVTKAGDGDEDQAISGERSFVLCDCALSLTIIHKKLMIKMTLVMVNIFK